MISIYDDVRYERPRTLFDRILWPAICALAVAVAFLVVLFVWVLSNGWLRVIFAFVLIFLLLRFLGLVI